jgi:hypothetical protein
MEPSPIEIARERPKKAIKVLAFWVYTGFIPFLGAYFLVPRDTWLVGILVGLTGGIAGGFAHAVYLLIRELQALKEASGPAAPVDRELASTAGASDKSNEPWTLYLLGLTPALGAVFGMTLGLALMTGAGIEIARGGPATLGLFTCSALAGFVALPALHAVQAAFERPSKNRSPYEWSMSLLPLTLVIGLLCLLALPFIPVGEIGSRSAQMSSAEVIRIVHKTLDEREAKKAIPGKIENVAAGNEQPAIGAHAGFTSNWLSSILWLVAGAAFVAALFCLFYMESATAAWGLITIGGLLSGAALIKEFKMESAIKVEELTLFKFARGQDEAATSPGEFSRLERVIDVGAFKLGSRDKFEDEAQAQKIFDELVQAWSAKKNAKKDGVLLFIGSTDEVPLSKSGQTRFEGNVGLARARAETVKSRFLQLVDPKLAPSAEQMLVLVSGPAGLEKGRGATGSPGERRVSVWASWKSPQREAK